MRRATRSRIGAWLLALLAPTAGTRLVDDVRWYGDPACARDRTCAPAGLPRLIGGQLARDAVAPAVRFSIDQIESVRRLSHHSPVATGLDPGAAGRGLPADARASLSVPASHTAVSPLCAAPLCIESTSARGPPNLL